jgi:hypothetical protein
MGACSTGTVDHGQFAHDEVATLLRVRQAIPPGTDADAAMATLKRAGWRCFRAEDALVFVDGRREAINTPDAIECDAYPALGGYPWSKGYDLYIVLHAGKTGESGVKIYTPMV